MTPDRFSLDGKVALVTGATRGIGQAIAVRFAAAGAAVMIVSRKQDAVDATVAGLQTAGARVAGRAANVSRPEDAARIIADTVKEFGGVDVLVNNAAANPVFGPVENTGTDAFDKIMGVNVRAPFDLAKAARPHFITRGGGVILNISSIGGISPEPNLGIYSVSKAAIISLTQVLAKEWGKDGIRANAICPGFIKTDFSSALWQNEKILAHILRTQALSKLGEPDDIATLALFLCSDAGSLCTGGVFLADAGYTI